MAEIAAPSTAAATLPQDLSPLRAFWAAFRENRGAMFGFCVVAVMRWWNIAATDGELSAMAFSGVFQGDGAKYVTGVVLPVDGGNSIGF